VALARGGTIELGHLPPDMVAGVGAARTGGTPSAHDLQPLDEAVAAFERQYIQRALESVGGHRTRAAALLGISRKSLWERLRDAPSRPDDEPQR